MALDRQGAQHRETFIVQRCHPEVVDDVRGCLPVAFDDHTVSVKIPVELVSIKIDWNIRKPSFLMLVIFFS